jgi:hypothetical protein
MCSTKHRTSMFSCICAGCMLKSDQQAFLEAVAVVLTVELRNVKQDTGASNSTNIPKLMAFWMTATQQRGTCRHCGTEL